LPLTLLGHAFYGSNTLCAQRQVKGAQQLGEWNQSGGKGEVEPGLDVGIGSSEGLGMGVKLSKG